MDGRYGLWKVVADELAAKGGRRLAPEAVVGTLDAFFTQEKSALIIFVDGINENTQVDNLRESLAFAVAEASGKRIRICLSCRDVDWRLFEDEPRLVRSLYEARRSGDRSGHGVFMENFTDAELDAAWAKYATAYQLTGDLTPDLATICRHPLMLQFLCEAFKRKRIPEGIHRREIFEKYWGEKLHIRRQHGTESALYTLVGEMFAKRVTEVCEPDVIRMTGEKDYSRLLSERVILYKRKARTGMNWVGFTYDAFLEFAIAKHLWAQWDWESQPVPRFRATCTTCSQQPRTALCRVSLYTCCCFSSTCQRVRRLSSRSLAPILCARFSASLPLVERRPMRMP